MRIETAVIPVAGAGTREFPVTTAIEKSMMPVYAGDASRPIIDFMVEDCATAGLGRVIFVTTERGQRQLQDYFGPDLTSTLRRQLERVGKTSKIDAELSRRRSYGLQFEYVIQPTHMYGTAVPLYLARAALRGEQHFALMGGDDFVYHEDGSSELQLALAGWSDSGTDHAIMGLPVNREDAPKYGILQTGSDGRLTAIDEKPPLQRVPLTPVANISRYLLSDAIWPHVLDEMQQLRGTGEHYVTYPIGAALAEGQTFHVHPVQGQYLDGGSFEGLLQASNYITAHPRTNQ